MYGDLLGQRLNYVETDFDFFCLFGQRSIGWQFIRMTTPRDYDLAGTSLSLPDIRPDFISYSKPGL